jgi:hypothetical protein
MIYHVDISDKHIVASGGDDPASSFGAGPVTIPG